MMAYVEFEPKNYCSIKLKDKTYIYTVHNVHNLVFSFYCHLKYTKVFLVTTYFVLAIINLYMLILDGWRSSTDKCINR